MEFLFLQPVIVVELQNENYFDISNGCYICTFICQIYTEKSRIKTEATTHT